VILSVTITVSTLTALGVGGLAVALALQDTLSKSFTDQFLMQHELRKRILRRFAAEGVRIPVQVRGVELRAAGGAATG